MYLFGWFNLHIYFIEEAKLRWQHEPCWKQKIEYWKSQLLDTGKRNKMINYRETARATLKIVEPGLDELYALVHSVPLSVCISRIGNGQFIISFFKKSTELYVLCSSYISLNVQRVHSSTAFIELPLSRSSRAMLMYEKIYMDWKFMKFKQFKSMIIRLWHGLNKSVPKSIFYFRGDDLIYWILLRIVKKSQKKQIYTTIFLVIFLRWCRFVPF